MIPTTKPALLIAALFNRRPTTPWSDKELRAYRKLYKAGCFQTLDDLELIGSYYRFERRKGDKGIHRRDLFTFLNNYPGELDRATAWRNRRFLFSRIKADVSKGTSSIEEGPTSDEDFKKIADLVKSQLEEFRARLRDPVPAEVPVDAAGAH